MMRKIIVILITLWLLLNVAFADVIKNYDVNITVLEDGRIDVVETITMNIDRNGSSEYLVWSMPRSVYVYGQKVDTPTEVLGLQRNNQPEKYWTRYKVNAFEVHLGQQDDRRTQEPMKGINTYQLHWQSANYVMDFGDYDQLSLDIIGGNRSWTIENITATVHLPVSVQTQEALLVYDNKIAKQKLSMTKISPTEMKFTMPYTLGYDHKLTLNVNFTKGDIPSIPTGYLIKLTDKLLKFLPSMIIPAHIVIVMMSVLMFVYWYFSYAIYCRRVIHNSRPFMARFLPPNLRFDQIILLASPYTYSKSVRAAMLTNLVYKGIITFRLKRHFIISHVKQEDLDRYDLTKSEAIFVTRLNQDAGGKISYARYNSVLNLADTEMRAYINNLGKSYYVSLMPWFGKIGCFVFLVGIVFVSQLMKIEFLLALLFPLFGWFVISLGGIFFRLWGAAFCWLPLVIIFGITEGIILGLLVGIFTYILSLNGKIKSVVRPEYLNDQQQVLEFKEFLCHANLNQEQFTPDLFEKYLSYAIAFGVDDEWVKHYRAYFPEEYKISRISGGIAVRNLCYSKFFGAALALGSKR